MGNIVNKYQRYCGTCSFWDGNVVSKDSVKVEIIQQMQNVVKKINTIIIKRILAAQIGNKKLNSF